MKGHGAAGLYSPGSPLLHTACSSMNAIWYNPYVGHFAAHDSWSNAWLSSASPV